MEGEKHIELTLGQDPGEFRLNVDGVAITINLKGLPQSLAATKAEETPTVAPPARPAFPETAPPAAGGDPQDTAQLSAELDHFRQVSREIYEGLGKLAKDINLSIQDLSLAEIIETGMGSPGEHLDQARHQVTDVLRMTEQATLNIMELVEGIREDCRAVQNGLLPLASSPGEGEELEPGAGPDRAAAQALWSQVLSQAEELDQLLRSPDSWKAAPSAGVAHFPLSDVLQIILEFCSNETVKQHLKAVQAKQDAVFRGAEAERALTLLAAGAPQEEGFYQLPLGPLLDLLKNHCEDDRVKELFTKMTTSAGKLFPVSALPLEPRSVEEEILDAPLPTPENPEVTSRWEALHQNLHLLAETQQAAPNVPAAGPGNGTAAAVVQEVLAAVDRITGSLSRIIEALSFQDLSGQRLLKILNILRQLQVQVLTLLVAAGQRFQEMLNGQVFPLQEKEQAREELDRLLHSYAPPSDQDVAAVPEEQPLDQSAINELLTGMGF